MLTFAGARPILVVGDVMLDRYVHGTARRLSPEAPVPVLTWRRDQHVPGGAANVAANVAALGGPVILAGVTGDDAAAAQLATELRAYDGRLATILVATPAKPTAVKTRYVSNGQQLLRLDREETDDLDAETERTLLDRIAVRLPECSVVVLSDYRKGTLTPRVLRTVIGQARACGCLVIVDPKRTEWAAYAGASVITPNRGELQAATGLPCDTDEEVEHAARTVGRRHDVTVLVTRSEHGMTLVEPERPAVHVAAQTREVFDVSGAGDTVVAVLAAVLAGGGALGEAMRIANVAAGLVVAKHGTATLTPSELGEALGEGTAPSAVPASRSEAVAQRVAWRREGLRVGFTNGCFDILHPGHISLFRQAAAACDRLIVALNTDASVSRLKGPTRPIQDELSRAAVVAALSFVDLVVLFDEDTPLALIQALQPDVLVKGADYREHEVVGADVVKQAGGRVILAELAAGQSTTAIVARSRRP